VRVFENLPSEIIINFRNFSKKFQRRKKQKGGEK